MRLTNLDLALALATRAMGTNEQHDLLQFADYLASSPTSKIFYEKALRILGIDPNMVPVETWGTPLPSEQHGREDLKNAIGILNTFWNGTDVHKRVAVRNLAWAATQLGRRLEADAEAKAKYVVKLNNGSTAGLFRAHVASPTRTEVHELLKQFPETIGEST